MVHDLCRAEGRDGSSGAHSSSPTKALRAVASDPEHGHAPDANMASPGGLPEPSSSEDPVAPPASEAPQGQQPGVPPWAQKRPLPVPVAVAKQHAPSPSSSSDSKAPSTAKRRNMFPKVRASEKCGKCDNCLNPQRKQACVEVRRRQMEQLGQQHQQKGAGIGAGATASTAQQSVRAGGSSKPAAPAAAVADAAAASDPFQRELKRMLAPSGAVVHIKHVPALVQLMQSARSMGHRYSLLAVLQLSQPDVLRAAVQHRALLPLQTWLSDCVAGQKPKAVAKVLACLDKLPVSTAALQPPCELGKIVGRLRKDESLDAATREQAKQLVAKWKRIVEQESSSRLLLKKWREGGWCGRAGGARRRRAASGVKAQQKLGACPLELVMTPITHLVLWGFKFRGNTGSS